MIATLNTKARDARVVALKTLTQRNADEFRRGEKVPAFQSIRQGALALVAAA